MRVPSNSIINSKYTIGDQFTSGSNPYQGYYYEMEGRVFAGKEFNPNATELIPKLPSFNTFPRSFTFSVPNIDDNPTSRYFSKVVNSNPISIKEINESDYNTFKNNIIYQVISLDWDINFGFSDTDLDNADKTMSGLKMYISEETNSQS